METKLEPDRLPESELVRQLEENWRFTFSALTALLPQGEVRALEEGLLVKTGFPIAFFNMCFFEDDAGNPREIVEESVHFFAGLPFTILVPDDQMQMAELCAGMGLQATDKVPGMALSPIPERPGSEPLEVRSLRSNNLSVYLDVFCEGFGLPRELAAHFFTEDLLEMEVGDHLIAYVNDDPIAVASVFDTGDVAGVYNIATHPGHRGKGYGTAVTWAAIERARLRGCRHAILQSSAMGYSVYTRMGFETVRNYLCYTNQP